MCKPNLAGRVDGLRARAVSEPIPRIHVLLAPTYPLAGITEGHASISGLFGTIEDTQDTPA